MNVIKTLSKKPIIGAVIKKAVKIVFDFNAMRIANHFSEFLTPKVASSEYLRNSAFNIRHQVYCEELKFEEEKENKLEKDEFDDQSVHCVIQHIKSHKFAGTVRLVCSKSDKQLLPIEKYCQSSITNHALAPSNFPRDKICEISRLAVPEEFRRRRADKFNGAATGAINREVYSEKELRCFPFIAVGLYLSAASLVINKGIEHVFVMMEPRLARSLSMVGIKFVQIGPVVDYHGKRAPFYITPELLMKSITPGVKTLFKNVKRDLENVRVIDEPLEAPATFTAHTQT